MADINNVKYSFPWKNGYYHSREMSSLLYLVDGENILTLPASGKPTKLLDNHRAKGTWKYGDFGEAHPDVAKATGKSRYNVEMIAFGGMWKVGLVLSDDGEKLTFYGMTHCVDVLEWMSEEALEEFILR